MHIEEVKAPILKIRVLLSEAVVRVGAEGIELDVHLSKDGYLIVMHDETVDRTTDGHGEIQQLTLNELKQLDAGSWFQKNPSVQCVPTLEDVLNCLVEEQFNGF